MNNNRQNAINSICSPLVNENESILKLKPMLLLSLLVLLFIIFLDFFLFETEVYIYLSLVVFPIFLMVIKRFYFIFTIYSVVFILFVIPKFINDLGTYFQVEMFTTKRIIEFIMKSVCLILLLIVYYTFFLYYKELKYLYIKQANISNNHLLDRINETKDFGVSDEEEENKNIINIKENI